MAGVATLKSRRDKDQTDRPKIKRNGFQPSYLMSFEDIIEFDRAKELRKRKGGDLDDEERFVDLGEPTHSSIRLNFLGPKLKLKFRRLL